MKKKNKSTRQNSQRSKSKKEVKLHRKAMKGKIQSYINKENKENSTLNNTDPYNNSDVVLIKATSSNKYRGLIYYIQDTITHLKELDIKENDDVIIRVNNRKIYVNILSIKGYCPKTKIKPQPVFRCDVFKEKLIKKASWLDKLLYKLGLV